MAELDELRATIAALEARRAALGDAVVEAATAALRERLRALKPLGQPATEGERKQVTVMFADLSGFTALAESADAEDVRNLANACFERVGQVVARYGGYIDKFIGDELMVLFGAPTAMEDHASRSLHAALKMRDVFAAFNEEHPQLQVHPLTLHFGINSGLVVAGFIGTEARRDYTVMGDPVNVAARLVARAQPGEILVGEKTHHLVGHGFESEDLGQMELEGRVESQHVYRLVGAGSSAQAVRGVANVQSRMIGREEELRAIQETVQDVVMRNQPRSVAVVGPAGIGKSRLRKEFQTWLEGAHPEVKLLHGGALAHMSATPYFMIAGLLKNWLAVTEGDSAVDIRDRLASSLAELGIDDPETLHALAAIMAVEYEEDRLKHLTPEERRDQIFSAFAACVKQIAERSPVVLLFEDLHWIDDVSMDLLEHLFGELVDSPVLFLTLTRPVLDREAKPRRVEARLSKHAHTRIILGELDERASSELVTSLAAGLDRSPQILQSIVRKGQGNPFYLEEIVRALMDQGILVRGEDGLRAVQDSSEVSVPDTVWGLLAERIDRLPGDEKRVIQAAAIVGRLFWQGLVHELTRLDPGDQLTALTQRDFVEPVGLAAFADDWEWLFRHILVQEVAYSGLLRETRKAGHLTAARWLEERVGDRRSEYSTLLAHHYQQGEHWTKTAEFAELAGDRAAALFAHREACVSYSQALDALGALDVDVETRRCQIDVTLKLARASSFTPSENVQEALEAAKEFADELEDEERRIRVVTAMATWLYVSGKARPAVELALQCVAGATEAGLEELLVAPYLILGRAMFLMGEYEKCVEMTEKSNVLAETYGHDLDEWAGLGLGPSFALLGAAYEILGHRERGHALCLQSLRIAEQKHDLRQIAFAHLFLGAPACSFGRLDEAEEHLRRAVAICEDTGDLTGLYTALGFLGHWYGQCGEVEQAAEHLDRALSIAAELESVVYLPFLQAYRAQVDIQTGRLAEAVTMAKRAVELGKETRQQDSEAEAHRMLGWAFHFTQPQARDDSERELRVAVELHRKTGSRVLASLTLYDLAAYLRLVGDEAGATEVESDASSIACELGLDWLPIPPPTPKMVST